MVDRFHKLKCSMSLKIHSMDSRVEYFPENLGDYSDEQGVRFHQDIKTNSIPKHAIRSASDCWNILA